MFNGQRTACAPGGVELVVKRFLQAVGERFPVLVLTGGPGCPEIAPGARRGGEQPRRVGRAASAGGGLGERVERVERERVVPALGAGLKQRVGVLLGQRPFATSGGEASEHEPVVSGLVRVLELVGHGESV